MSGFRYLRLERVDIRAELVALIVALVVRELGDSHTVLWGQRLEERLLVIIECGRIVAVEVGDTQPAIRGVRMLADGLNQTIQRQECQRIGADILSDFLDGFLRGNQLLGRLDVDAVEARVFQRW